MARFKINLDDNSDTVLEIRYKDNITEQNLEDRLFEEFKDLALDTTNKKIVAKETIKDGVVTITLKIEDV